MKKTGIRLFAVVLSLLMLLCIVACQQDVEKPVDNLSPKSKATTFYMPNGWAKTVTTTPLWTSKDEGTVDTSKINLVLEGDGKTNVTNVTPELKAALAAAVADLDYFKDVKNIIIIISDGMGVTHVQASEYWSGELIMTQLPNVGISMTDTRERESGTIKNDITDSAAGGTALSTGYKTTKLFAAMDAEGNNLKSVSELAREQDKLVGIVTNAELADATPAVYSIHNKNRSQGWTKMCQQQIVFGADLFMGNGRDDYQGYFDYTNELYPFVTANNMKRWSTAVKVVEHFADDTRMWAIFNGTANQFARFDTADAKFPNLQQMTAYALAWLDSHDTSDKGFVVMIENTYTDHFGHGNDLSELKKEGFTDPANTYGIVKEVQSTDEAVAIALKYVLEHPDTALIVTADHETGNTILRDGWKDDFSMIKAASGSHSAQNVPVFAIGKGTEALNSLTRSEAERAAGARWDEAIPYENYRIGRVVGALLGDPYFGGDVNTDNSSKTSPKFEVTVTAPAETLTFTLDLMGVPIYKNEVHYGNTKVTPPTNPYNNSMVQFKVKPVNEDDRIKIELKKSDGTYVDLYGPDTYASLYGLNQKAEDYEDQIKDLDKFSSAVIDSLATDENGVVKTDKEGKVITVLNTDYKGNVTTPISYAYKQAFTSKSGYADGWYQFSLPATAFSTQIRITLTAASGSFEAGDVIGMDDLTIQYGSTIGWLKFSSDNATATTEAGTPLLKYYTED